jgi:predicted PurR-regulated permease PerM
MPEAVSAANRLKNKISAAEVPSQKSMMTLAVSVAVISGLYFTREVMIPITLAVLLSFVLAPLVGRLRHLGLWRVPSVLLAVVLALGIIIVLGGVIGLQVAQLANQAPAYSYTVQKKIDAIQSYTNAKVASMTNALGSNQPAPAERPKSTPDPNAVKPTPVEVHQPEATPFQILERVAMPVMGPLGSLGIMLVVAVFILMQLEDMRDRLIRLFGSSDLHRTTAALDDAAARLSRYFLTQLALNAGFGVVVGIALFFIGVPSPALFGIIAALFRFVPYIGAIGSAALPMALAAAVDPGWTMVVETAALFVAIELLTGQVLEPLIYGHSTGLSPVSVVIAAIFWAWLWGPVGLILSMPLTLCLVVLGRHVKHLEFIEVLLGDKPALTPSESFYQRMLAGDADEALDQAETLLRDRTLVDYYDQVALPGLGMAANDSLRGVLTDEQLEHIQDSLGAVVMDLGEHAQSPGTPPTPHPGAVLCIGARGPLDEAVCTMLAQVLARRGLQARVVSQDAVSRGAIEQLDLNGVTAVCISYLEASGSFSSLRYLVRRLRQRADGVPILVGLWQAEFRSNDEERLRGAIGADHYTTTLAGTIEACLTHVQPAQVVVAA